MQLPSLASLIWSWYWQSKLAVEEHPHGYEVYLLNHETITLHDILPSWQYSAEVTGLHPATYATEELWESTQDLEWRMNNRQYRITRLLPRYSEYYIPQEQVPSTDHLKMTWLLRQGYSIEECPGVEIIIHTPRGAFRQVRHKECSCGDEGLCVHKQLASYYSQYRPILRKYPSLARDAERYANNVVV